MEPAQRNRPLGRFPERIVSLGAAVRDGSPFWLSNPHGDVGQPRESLASRMRKQFTHTFRLKP